MPQTREYKYILPKHVPCRIQDMNTMSMLRRMVHPLIKHNIACQNIYFIYQQKSLAWKRNGLKNGHKAADRSDCRKSGIQAALDF